MVLLTLIIITVPLFKYQAEAQLQLFSLLLASRIASSSHGARKTHKDTDNFVTVWSVAQH
jgi:hypothetical protein